jgi:hypothetical protein
VLFRNGDNEGSSYIHGDDAAPYIPLPKLLALDCDLYLYDGPPGIAPRHVKMIMFTSPSFG